MPIYLYKNPKTGTVKEVVQKMNDEHTYEQDGVKWERVFTAPNASIDTKVDPDDKVKFIEKTGNMKGSLGDMMDYSSELSEERAKSSETGEDPVKRKHFQDYEKKVGKKHLSDKKKTIETDKVKIDLE
jgi:hypothetical protein